MMRGRRTGRRGPERAFRRRFLIAALSVAALGVPAHASDAEANAVYERFQATATASDPTALLEKVYAAGSTYLPRHKEAGVEPRDAVIKMVGGSQRHLRSGGGQIDIRFRVVERKRLGNIYIDNGFMRTTVRPSEGAPEQVTYGKFATVIAKQPEGHWAFVADADSESTANRFDNAKPAAGAKFDR
jgi:hypothetical protein